MHILFSLACQGTLKTCIPTASVVGSTFNFTLMNTCIKLGSITNYYFLKGARKTSLYMNYSQLVIVISRKFVDSSNFLKSSICRKSNDILKKFCDSLNILTKVNIEKKYTKQQQIQRTNFNALSCLRTHAKGQ